MTKVLATIEARMTSSRLPGKVLLPAAGDPMLVHMVRRVRKAKGIDDIVVATTKNDADIPILESMSKEGIKCYRGSEHDVLQRVLEAALINEADIIVELTGDCPLIDWNIIEDLISVIKNDGYDYASNTVFRCYPDGFDVQVFPITTLENIAKSTKDPTDREHVTWYLLQNINKYKVYHLNCPIEFYDPNLRLTLDYPEDYEIIKCILEDDSVDHNTLDFKAILNLISSNNALREINKHRESLVP